jgi:hypothetical protein
MGSLLVIAAVKTLYLQYISYTVPVIRSPYTFQGSRGSVVGSGATLQARSRECKFRLGYWFYKYI